MARATKIVAKVSGQPGVGKRIFNWPRVNRPMRPIRTVRTLIKGNVADGVTQPEFRNTLQRAGVGVRMLGKTISRQRPNTPPSFGQRGGGKVVSPPSPTNKGGVRSPYHK